MLKTYKTRGAEDFPSVLITLRMEPNTDFHRRMALSSSKYPDEKRKESRAEFYAQVALRSGKAEILPKSRAQDISMTGIFIVTEKPIPVGKDCDVHIYLKGKSSILMLLIKGTVVRNATTGIGITFKKLDVDTYFLLNTILNNAVLDPTTIINEIFPFE